MAQMSKIMNFFGVGSNVIVNYSSQNEVKLSKVFTELRRLNIDDSALNRLIDELIENTKKLNETSEVMMNKAIEFKTKMEEIEEIKL
ncbi:MAG: hypothetical protein WC755_07330 [Candidatus Woesearchaeota archaeon]